MTISYSRSCSFVVVVFIMSEVTTTPLVTVVSIEMNHDCYITVALLSIGLQQVLSVWCSSTATTDPKGTLRDVVGLTTVLQQQPQSLMLF